MVQILQINAHHSEGATSLVRRHMDLGLADVALIQEPYIGNKNRVIGFGAKYKTLWCSGTTKVRTCIVAQREINLTLLPDLCDGDTTVAAWNRPPGEGPPILLAAVYLPYEQDTATPGLARLLARAATEEALIGCDANAHHTVWGSSNTNKRGESLLDLLSASRVVLLNRGNSPTFVIKNRSEVIDISLATPDTAALSTGWMVSDQPSGSDHRWLCWEIRGGNPDARRVRNPRKARWVDFQAITSLGLRKLHTAVPALPRDIDRQVSVVTEVLVKSFHKVCPLKTVKAPTNSWWTGELTKLREDLRKSFDTARHSDGDESLWTDYKEKLSWFKRETRRAKREAWRTHCDNIETTIEANRLRRSLSNRPHTPTMLQDEQGQWMDSEQKCAELLTVTHFPGATELAPPAWDENNGGPRNLELIRQIVSPDRIQWALSSFRPYKAAGPDGVIPAMLQKADRKILGILSRTFEACLTLSYIPSEWRKAKVVFIPKQGKLNHAKPKDLDVVSTENYGAVGGLAHQRNGRHSGYLQTPTRLHGRQINGDSTTPSGENDRKVPGRQGAHRRCLPRC